MENKPVEQTDGALWDWIVIGTGMGGSTFGHALAKGGRRVLFIEKGADRRVNRQKKSGHYLESLIPNPLARSEEDYQNTGRSHTKIWDATRGRWLNPILGSGTGGSSALYGMVMERFWKEDFEPGAWHTNSKSALPDRWPVSFEEMEPYYKEAERLFRVSSTDTDPLRADQTFQHLPRPPLRNGGALLMASLQAQGLHPYTLPLARTWGTPCQFCQSFLCDHDCKNDGANICLEPALESHGASLLTGAEVLEITADANRVTGVNVRMEGRTFSIEARHVALAAGALLSPVLLLKSRSPHWPQGLANKSGMVGRHLMRHHIELIGVPSPGRPEEKGDQKEIGLNDFYVRHGKKFGSLADFGAMPPVSVLMEDLDHDVAVLGRLQKKIWGLIRPLARWVLERIVERYRFLALIMEDLPFLENRVEPGFGGADITLHSSVGPEEWARIRQARTLVRKALGGWATILLSNAKNTKLLAHACGTCRMGNDPKTSVVDRFNRAHGVENLYVVDSSFFPSSGGVNPALTIAANALRVAQHILDETPETQTSMDLPSATEPAPPACDKTLVDLFLESAAHHSKQIFCHYKTTDGSWVAMTYERARHHVLSLAGGLRKMGIKSGEGLAIMASSRWEWVALELAALRVGAFVTGIETHGSKEDIEFRLKHSGVRALAVEAETLSTVPESVLEKMDFVILLDPSPTAVRKPKEVTFDQLECFSHPGSLEGITLPTSNDAAALLYTSGTTGAPKAILYRHYQIVAAIQAVLTALPNVGPSDSVLCWLPLAHLFQRMINYVAISRGVPLAFSADPKHVLADAKEIRPTIFLGVPRFYEKLWQGMEQKATALPSWIPRFILHPLFRRTLGGRVRLLITGSAPIPAAALDFFQRIGLPLYEAYGVSENTLPIAMNTPGSARLGSVGHPLPGNTVRVTQEGEICVKGPGLCEGYWKTEAAFPLDEDGFYHTGDLGRLDGDGFLHLLGRRDDIFKTSTGRKIVPSRLESIYGASPLFERVMAIGRGKPYPALLVWLKEPSSNGPQIDGERILSTSEREPLAKEISRLGQDLPVHERAGAFLVVAGNPAIADGTLTASLKLRRHKVEERLASRIDALYSGSPEAAPWMEPPVPARTRFPSQTTGQDGETQERKAGRPRVLFVAEAVALSHPARLMEIARGLDPEAYEIHFASDPRYRNVLGPVDFFTHDIESIPPVEFDRTVARGGVFFTEQVIERYVQQEQILFDKIRPDIVVGEFRPSLGISARLAGVPYLSVLNAYYNPTAQVRHVLPEYPLTEWIPQRIGQWLYHRLRSWGYARHGRPLNTIRRRHGLPPLEGDLRHALADADWTLFPDLNRLFPNSALAKNHCFMAPVSWSPTVPLPRWWDRLPVDRPVVYANLGSSGRHGVLQRVLNALSALPVTVIAATAGRQPGLTVPPNAFITDFLPGQDAARRSDLVITNGGNMSGYQALAEGKPILGLASNVDQFLNMAALEDAGVGKLLRSGSFSSQDLQTAVQELLNNPNVRQTAQSVGLDIVGSSNHAFQNILDKVLSPILEKKENPNHEKELSRFHSL